MNDLPKIDKSKIRIDELVVILKSLKEKRDYYDNAIQSYERHLFHQIQQAFIFDDSKEIK